jgi:AbrB family looped-hinge helix DNA binding protein
MDYRYNSNKTDIDFVKAQKQGPQSTSITLPKVITKNLGIRKGTYVMIYQSDDKIIIKKVENGGEFQ